MPTKTFVLLVDSVKFKCHCIGGREVTLDAAGNVNGFGPWVRPVSPAHAHGELGNNEIQYANRALPQILDIIRFEGAEPQNHAYQPENWVVQNVSWRKVGEFPLARVYELQEQPPSLWVPYGRLGQTDRISSAELTAHPMRSSLVLAQPENLQIHVRWEVYNGQPKVKRRASFVYNGVHYDLGVTDPRLQQRYFPNFPRDAAPRTFQLESGDNCLIVFSMTPELNGYHYKLATSFIELR